MRNKNNKEINSTNNVVVFFIFKFEKSDYEFNF